MCEGREGGEGAEREGEAVGGGGGRGCNDFQLPEAEQRRMFDFYTVRNCDLLNPTC